MSNILVLDICEKPKFSVFIENQLIYCGDCRTYSLDSIVKECVDSFVIDEVKLLIKPVSVDKIEYFALAKVQNGFVNIAVKDINRITTMCRQFGIKNVILCSYISYYSLIRQGNSIVLDYTYDDNMIAVVYSDSELKAVHIDKQNVIEKILLDKYKIGELDKYSLINAKSFRMEEYYPQLIANYVKSMDKILNLVSPSIFAVMDTQGFLVKSAVKVPEVKEEEPEQGSDEPNKTEQEEDTKNRKLSKEEKKINHNRAVVTKDNTKKSKGALKDKPSKTKEKIKVVEDDVEEEEDTFSIFTVINVLLGLVLGVLIVCSYQLPSDLAGLHDYLYASRQQIEVYNSFLDTSNRVEKTVENDNAKLSYIYNVVRTSPFDGIIGKVEVAGDNVELELYLNDTVSITEFQSYLGNIINIINTQDQGYISVGDKSMLKITITGQINY